jgi:type IV pilus assembly protein PilX
MTSPHRHHNSRPARQQGLALIFALIGLLALSMGAVALLHAVDSGTRVLGNLGFKQEATASADRATQAAIEWLGTNSASLTATDASNGYYALAYDNLDATGQASGNAGRVMVDWNNDSCLYASGTVGTACTLTPRTVASAGSAEPLTLRYVIFRLCSATGATTATGNSCAQPSSSGAGVAADKGSLDYSKPSPLVGSAQGTYYRVVVQAVDARSTTSITETIVQF